MSDEKYQVLKAVSSTLDGTTNKQWRVLWDAEEEPKLFDLIEKENVRYLGIYQVWKYSTTGKWRNLIAEIINQPTMAIT